MSVSRPGNMRGTQGKTPLLLLLLLLTTLAATGSCQDYGGEDEADTQYDTDEQEPVADGDGETAEPTSSIPELPLTSALPPTEEAGEADPYLGDNTDDHGSAFSPEIQQFHERELGESGTEILTLMEETSEHDWTEATVTDDPNFTGPTSTPLDQEGLSPTIILVPVVLVILIIGMIVCCIVINRRWNNKARNKGTSNIADSRKEDPYLDGSSTEKVPMPMFEEDVPSVLELEMEELDQWMKKDG